MTGDQWLNYPQVQTGIQTHATCQNVAAINTDLNARTVQENFGNASGIGDPFWNYVPFQKTAVPGGVGGDADPAKWITVVKTSTNGLPGAPAGGVDLATINDAAAARTACEALGGVYVPADTQGGSQASAQISDAVIGRDRPAQPPDRRPDRAERDSHAGVRQRRGGPARAAQPAAPADPRRQALARQRGRHGDRQGRRAGDGAAQERRARPRHRAAHVRRGRARRSSP